MLDARTQLVQRLWALTGLLLVVVLAYACGCLYEEREWVLASYQQQVNGGAGSPQDSRFEGGQDGQRQYSAGKGDGGR